MLAPDLRGHGRSTAAISVQPTFDLLAHDVLALTSRLGLRDGMVLVGVSMGAGIALRMALTAQERVAGLVCIRPVWEHHAHPPHLRILEDLADHLNGDDSDRARFAGSNSYQALCARFPEAAQSLSSQFDTFEPRRAASMLKAMPASTPYAAPGDLARVRCPTLIVGNHEDPWHPFALAQRWAAAITPAELHEVPRRYTRATEHAAALADLVSGFVTSIDNETSS